MKPPKRNRVPSSKQSIESRPTKKAKRNDSDNSNSRRLISHVPVPPAPRNTVTIGSEIAINHINRPQLTISHGPVISIVHGEEESSISQNTSDSVAVNRAVNSSNTRPLTRELSSSVSARNSSSLNSSFGPPGIGPSAAASAGPSHRFTEDDPGPSSKSSGLAQNAVNSELISSSVGTSSVQNPGMLGIQVNSDSSETHLKELQAPEMIQSIYDPISAHIPAKLKEKLWGGEFIELSMLLKSSRDLLDEFSGFEGNLALKGGLLSVVNKKYTPINQINIWTSAFMVYASVMLEKWPLKGIEFFKYMHSVRTAAFRGYAEGWISYDEQYRLRKSRNPSSSWAVVDSELWLLYVSTPNASNFSHSLGFIPTSQPAQTCPSNDMHASRQTDTNLTQRSTPTVYCKLFNTGFCTYGKRCKFVHKCSKCNWNHPFTSCKN